MLQMLSGRNQITVGKLRCNALTIKQFGIAEWRVLLLFLLLFVKPLEDWRFDSSVWCDITSSEPWGWLPLLNVDIFLWTRDPSTIATGTVLQSFHSRHQAPEPAVNAILELDLDTCREAWMMLRALARVGPQSVSGRVAKKSSKALANLNPGHGLMTWKYNNISNDLWNTR